MRPSISLISSPILYVLHHTYTHKLTQSHKKTLTHTTYCTPHTTYTHTHTHIHTYTLHTSAGKDTLEFQRIITLFERITATLKSNPAAFKCLRLKLIENGWQNAADRLTEEELLCLIADRIKLDASQFGDYMDMLKDIEGLDLVADMLTSECLVVYC